MICVRLGPSFSLAQSLLLPLLTQLCAIEIRMTLEDQASPSNAVGIVPYCRLVEHAMAVVNDEDVAVDDAQATSIAIAIRDLVVFCVEYVAGVAVADGVRTPTDTLVGVTRLVCSYCSRDVDGLRTIENKDAVSRFVAVAMSRV